MLDFKEILKSPSEEEFKRKLTDWKESLLDEKKESVNVASGFKADMTSPLNLSREPRDSSLDKNGIIPSPLPRYSSAVFDFRDAFGSPKPKNPSITDLLFRVETKRATFYCEFVLRWKEPMMVVGLITDTELRASECVAPRYVFLKYFDVTNGVDVELSVLGPPHYYNLSVKDDLELKLAFTTAIAEQLETYKRLIKSERV